MLPSQQADETFEAIRQKRFYIYPPEFKKGIATRMEDILQLRPPTLLVPKEVQ